MVRRAGFPASLPQPSRCLWWQSNGQRESAEIKELLKKGLEELGYSPDDDRLNAFLTYLSELKKWNRTYNLTGLRTDEDIIIRHFLDSALYLTVMPDEKITVADIGSGAGFPGIPMKMIRPRMELYLVEPSAKKAAFLNHLIAAMHLDAVTVIEKRVEEIRPPGDIVPVDAAVSRALFSVKDFVKKTSRIVKPGGRLVLSKGPKVSGELKTLQKNTIEVIVRRLPLTDIERFFVVITL